MVAASQSWSDRKGGGDYGASTVIIQNQASFIIIMLSAQKKDFINSIMHVIRFSPTMKKLKSLDILQSILNCCLTKTDWIYKMTRDPKEMKKDDNSHYLIYRVLGISHKEGMLIDEYQNTGRFLYKYAGSFLEETASMCLFFANSSGSKKLVKNTQGRKPKTFEIDFLNGNDAVELKWRDATTDGDHITKEHTRVKAIQSHGYRPIRVMFYYPQRKQAIRIQKTLETIYTGVQGEY